jgi:hypothetical protein
VTRSTLREIADQFQRRVKERAAKRICLNQHHWLANRMRENGIEFSNAPMPS